MTKTANQERTEAARFTSESTDRLDVADLVFRLGACLDEHRFDDIHRLFTEDATATTPGGTAHGRRAVIEQATRNHESYDRLHHQMTNVLVDLDGDRAAVRANLVATFAQDSSQPELVLGAVCRFTAQRDAQGWQLASLRVDPVWRVSPA